MSRLASTSRMASQSVYVRSSFLPTGAARNSVRRRGFSAKSDIGLPPPCCSRGRLEHRRKRMLRGFMFERGFAAAIALTAALGISSAAMAFDDAKYPDLTGQWVAVRIPGVKGQPAFDPTKSWGLGQEAPLTPEYLKVLEASLADQAKGGQGGWPTGWCLPPGMPAMMTLYRPMEVVVLARDHLYPDRSRHQFPSAHLHRRTRLAGKGRAVLRRLFHRQMDRRRRQWPLQRPRGRDQVFQGPARLRSGRVADPCGQPDGGQGALLLRQGQSSTAAR